MFKSIILYLIYFNLTGNTSSAVSVAIVNHELKQLQQNITNSYKVCVLKREYLIYLLGGGGRGFHPQPKK